jgi:hypothetical protein
MCRGEIFVMLTDESGKEFTGDTGDILVEASTHLLCPPPPGQLIFMSCLALTGTTQT